MGFFDKENESNSPIGLLRAHIGTFMYYVKIGNTKFKNKEGISDIFYDMEQTKFLLDQATRGTMYDFRKRIDEALWDAAVHKYSEDLDHLKKELLKAVDAGAAQGSVMEEEEEIDQEEPEETMEESGDWKASIKDEMKAAEEAARKKAEEKDSGESEEKEKEKTDDGTMTEADCRELWKLIKGMDKEFIEMKQIADDWLMVNRKKGGCFGMMAILMLLPLGAVYGIWSVF